MSEETKPTQEQAVEEVVKETAETVPATEDNSQVAEEEEKKHDVQYADEETSGKVSILIYSKKAVFIGRSAQS